MLPRKFLLARQEASYINPYGFADLSMCVGPTVFKHGGLRFRVTFVEKFGTLWGQSRRRAARHGPDRAGCAARQDGRSLIQATVAVMPDDANSETLSSEGKGMSSDLYRKLPMFCRSEVSIALLGQNQSTEASSTHDAAP